MELLRAEMNYLRADTGAAMRRTFHGWGERNRDPGKRQLAPAAGGFGKEMWIVDLVTKSHV